jgi:hypothetical protein
MSKRGYHFSENSNEEIYVIGSNWSSAKLRLLDEPAPDQVPYVGVLDDEAIFYYQDQEYESAIAAHAEELIQKRNYSPEDVKFVEDSGEVQRIFSEVFEDEIKLGSTWSVKLGRPVSLSPDSMDPS